MGCTVRVCREDIKSKDGRMMLRLEVIDEEEQPVATTKSNVQVPMARDAYDDPRQQLQQYIC